MRERMTEVKDRVMGSAGQAGEHAGQLKTDVEDRLAERGDQARRVYQGNPLAVGLVAFGAGMVAAAAFPPTPPERKLAESAQPAIDQATQRASEAGREMVEDLREPARESAENLKDTASHASQQVRSG